MITDFELKRGKSKFNTILNPNVYSNIEFYSPDDKLMFLGSQKKLDWYLKKNLIEKIGNNQYKFLFTPKGNGHYGDSKWEQDSYKMRCMIKQNVCVVSGKNTNLTKHHIVPAAYIKYFPLPDYVNNRLGHHDVVLLNNHIHEEYEIKALQLKEKLCKKYDIRPFKDACKIQGKIFTTVKRGRKLLDEKNKQDNPHYINQLNNFCNTWFIEPEQLEEFVLQKEKDIDALNGHYKELASKLDTLDKIQEFCEIWRKHFIDTMKPKHLPKEWSIKTQISPNI